MSEGAVWPVIAGKRAITQRDPITGYDFCESCWNGRHSRTDCIIAGCQCGCYGGRNRGMARVHPPARDCDEQESFLGKVPTIQV